VQGNDAARGDGHVAQAQPAMLEHHVLRGQVDGGEFGIGDAHGCGGRASQGVGRDLVGGAFAGVGDTCCGDGGNGGEP